MNIVQALGYQDTDRLLIVNADDFGMCHATNAGIIELLEEGAISSSTLMMPCPWAKEAAEWAAAHPAYDVGVHLTLTSEWEMYKWGPVNRASDTRSLVTDEGSFPRDCLTVERVAETEQVRAELLAQLELARRMGLDPTHLDNHMGSLYGLETGRHFLDLVLEICAAEGLPFRMPRSTEGQNVPPEMEEAASSLAGMADQLGVAILDNLTGLRYSASPPGTYEEMRDAMTAILRGLQPGLTEIIIHPSKVTEELKAITSNWERRGYELKLFRDPLIRQVLEEEGIRMIRWADVREAQRAAAGRV